MCQIYSHGKQIHTLATTAPQCLHQTVYLITGGFKGANTTQTFSVIFSRWIPADSMSVLLWCCCCLFWGDHESRGWYDSPQPALRPVFTAAQCATPCVCKVAVCMGDVGLLSYWHCVFTVCESIVLYIYSAQSQLQVSLGARPVRPLPERHRATQAHLPPQQGHSRLVLQWPNVMCIAQYLSCLLYTSDAADE